MRPKGLMEVPCVHKVSGTHNFWGSGLSPTYQSMGFSSLSQGRTLRFFPGQASHERGQTSSVRQMPLSSNTGVFNHDGFSQTTFDSRLFSQWLVSWSPVSFLRAGFVAGQPSVWSRHIEFQSKDSGKPLGWRMAFFQWQNNGSYSFWNILAEHARKSISRFFWFSRRTSHKKDWVPCVFYLAKSRFYDTDKKH